MKDPFPRYSISQRNKFRKNLSEEIRDTWHGGCYDPATGRTMWKSLRTAKKGEAQRWRDRMNAARFMPPESRAEPVAMEDAAEKFLLEVENVRKRVAGTVKLYRAYLSQFKKFCERSGIKEMREVTPQLCGEFAQEAFASHSAHTAKSKVILFRQFFSWAAERYGMQGKNPFKKITVARPKPLPREFWTVEECERIIAAAPSPECKCWFALMAFAGLRREEARHLKYADIMGGCIELVGKGGKAAKVPISTKLKAYLNEYLLCRMGLPVKGPLFPGLASLRAFREKILRKAVEDSGIASRGKSHCHRFRHSFASNLVRAGRNIKAVQMLMRHENVALTLNIYGHLLPSDLEQAAEL
jgi:site-specific recombinase XerD